MFRIYFLYNRDLIPKLSHCGWEAVKEVFQATLGRDDVTPGLVMDPAPLQRCGVHIQTYGRWANWNPHLHGIASDGCFDSEGHFYPLPKISNLTLEKVFTTKVLAMLLEEKLITEDLSRKILSWKYTGFSTHTKVRIDSDNKEGLQGLAQYIIRCPISEDKIILSPDKHTVIYKSALKYGIKKNFEVYNVLEFLAALTSHIPKAGRKMTIYYGWYSQAARGKRRKNGTQYNRSITEQVEDDNRILRYRWSTLIKMVYADPLICPNCGGKMKIIAFIKKKSVIEHILKHLGLLDELPHAHSPPSKEPPYDITYEPFFDDIPLSEQIELAQTAR